MRVLAVDVDLDAGAAAGAQRRDEHEAWFAGNGPGDHVLVLAGRPAAVFVVGQEPAGPGDVQDVGEQAGGDGLRTGGAEGRHVRGGEHGLQPVPPDVHGGTLLAWRTRKRVLAHDTPGPA